MIRHKSGGAVVFVSVVATLALAAGCSSTKSLQGGTDTSPATSTSAAPEVTTTAPPVTDAPTTVAETTTAPTTTPAPTPAGWTFIDAATAQGPLAYPCCASNWYGSGASPPLPAPGGALADGAYRIELDWPTDFSKPVSATVTRFEQCNVLPAGSCEDNGGGAYADDELGIDGTTSFELPIEFDDQLRVVLGGFAGWDAPGFATANGLDIAALVTALDADYQVMILDPYLGGATQDQITAALTAAPANGFSAPADPGAGALVYTHDGAPPLLFQGLVGFDDTPNDTRGSDIIGRIALVVSGGQSTINLYAGFYS